MTSAGIAALQRLHGVHEERLLQFKSGYESRLAEFDESSSEYRVRNIELSDEIEELKQNLSDAIAMKEEMRGKWAAAHENFQRTLQVSRGGHTCVVVKGTLPPHPRS